MRKVSLEYGFFLPPPVPYQHVEAIIEIIEALLIADRKSRLKVLLTGGAGSKKLVSRVSSESFFCSGATSLTIFFTSDTQHLMEALAIVDGEFLRLAFEKIRPEELDRVKRYLIKRDSSFQEAGAAQTDILAVTADEIHSFAQQFLIKENRRMVVNQQI
jgi:hypothetical protein